MNVGRIITHSIGKHFFSQLHFGEIKQRSTLSVSQRSRKKWQTDESNYDLSNIYISSIYLCNIISTYSSWNSEKEKKNWTQTQSKRKGIQSYFLYFFNDRYNTFFSSHVPFSLLWIHYLFNCNVSFCYFFKLIVFIIIAIIMICVSFVVRIKLKFVLLCYVIQSRNICIWKRKISMDFNIIRKHQILMV